MCQLCLDKPESDKEKEYDSEWADTVVTRDTIVLKGGRNADGSYRIVYRGQTKTSALHPKNDGYVFVRWIYPEH